MGRLELDDKIIEKFNNEVSINLKRYHDLLKKYNYNSEDFFIRFIEVEDDKMNDSFPTIEERLVCIPKEFKDSGARIIINFTCDNIQLVDNSGNLLCRTCDIGYDDIETPKFFI